MEIIMEKWAMDMRIERIFSTKQRYIEEVKLKKHIILINLCLLGRWLLMIHS
jgi:hypothetical protein